MSDNVHNDVTLKYNALGVLQDGVLDSNDVLCAQIKYDGLILLSPMGQFMSQEVHGLLFKTRLKVFLQMEGQRIQKYTNTVRGIELKKKNNPQEPSFL